MRSKCYISLSLILFGLLILPTGANAETNGYLEYDGTMDIKVGRLQETDAERERKKEDQSETMLDKMGIPLFTEKMEEEIMEKERENQEQWEQIESILFTEESETGQTVEKAKDSLFNDGYQEYIQETSEETTEQKQDNYALGGMIGGSLLALVGGIYVASRNIW